AKRLHDLPHVVVAVVHERLDEMRQRRADVAKMDLPDLPGAKEADHLLRVFAGELLAAFEPRSAAEADSHVRTVRDLHRWLVAFEGAEDAARHTGQHRHRRIVRVNADPYARLFRHRD